MGGITAGIAAPIRESVRDVMASVGAEVNEDPQSLRRLRAEPVSHELVQEIPQPYIAAKFREATFSGFEVDPGEPSHYAAVSAAREFCRRVVLQQPTMLALIGPPGTGKSHLLYAATARLRLQVQRVFTRPWYLLADHLRYGGPALFRDEWLEPHHLRHALMQEPVIMIDEVRPTAGTAFDDTELAKIACHAWDNGRSMMITTNVSPLSDVMGAAVASRFTQVTISDRVADRRQSL